MIFCFLFKIVQQTPGAVCISMIVVESENPSLVAFLYQQNHYEFMLNNGLAIHELCVSCERAGTDYSICG